MQKSNSWGGLGSGGREECCFKCGDFGHFPKDCSASRKQSESSGSPIRSSELDQEVQRCIEWTQQLKRQASEIDRELSELAQMRVALEEEKERLERKKIELDERESRWNEKMASRQQTLKESQVNSQQSASGHGYDKQAIKIEAIEHEKEADMLIDLENVSPRVSDRRRESRCSTIEEEEDKDEFEPPPFKATPPRSYPRQSIGQWSVERMKNNMSVRSMVSTFEDKTTTRAAKRGTKTVR